MIMTPVKSSNIKAIGYDGANLHVDYSGSGHNYVYQNVSREQYQKLMQAPSLGKYLNTQIKPNHKANKK